jgi:UDP-glucuronate 4-epimerase
MKRDFTYVADLVEAVTRLVECAPVEGASAGPMDSLSPAAPYRVVNVGGGNPVGLLDFIDEVERALDVPVLRRMRDMQPGDVPQTYASADLLEALTGYRPATPLAEGVRAFVDWRRAYGG